MKKFFAFILVLALALSMMAMPATADEGGLSEPGVLPIWTGSEPYPLSVLTASSDYVSDWDNNAYTKWIEESCNVDLSFEFLPPVESDAKLNIMIQTGDKLPDIICRGISLDNALMFEDAGGIIDCTEYYENGAAYNTLKADAAYPELYLIGNITSADGKILGVPKIQLSLTNETKYKLWVNTVYLNNLGIEELPTTIDEFTEMLRRFRDEDANGNGVADDEIPLLGSSSWGGNPVKYLTNAFVHEGDNDMWMVKDGKVTASYLQPEWLDACNYLRMLVSEGLMGKEAFTYARPDIIAVAANNNNLVGCLFDSSLGFFGGEEGSETYLAKQRYRTINPLVGPNGYQSVAFAASATNIQWVVTADCEQPELAFRVGDFQFQEEGYMRGRFGVENENWMTTDTYLAANPGAELEFIWGQMGYEMKYITATKTGFDGPVNVFGEVQNVNWYDAMPYFSGYEECKIATVKKYPANAEYPDGYEVTTQNWQGLATAYMQSVKPDENTYCPNLNFSADESAEWGEVRSTLRTFVNEQRSLYVLGQPSMLDNPDAFYAELNTIGVEGILEVANTAYARQYGK